MISTGIEAHGRAMTAYLQLSEEERRLKHSIATSRRDARLKAARERYASDITYRDKIRSKVLFSSVGITLEERDRMLEAQGHKCASCGDEESSSGWNVDHDHKTGRVRGVLCAHCNRMLGQAKDDPERLRKGAEYLERCFARTR